MSKCAHCGKEMTVKVGPPSCGTCYGSRLIPAAPGTEGARKLDLLVWVKPCPDCTPDGTKERPRAMKADTERPTWLLENLRDDLEMDLRSIDANLRTFNGMRDRKLARVDEINTELARRAAAGTDEGVGADG